MGKFIDVRGQLPKKQATLRQADKTMIETILHFWFGELRDELIYNESHTDIWFINGRQYDAVIRERFGAIHSRAALGELNHWAETPRGRLALVLVLDQFSRHLYRETPQAFVNDERAQQLVLAGMNCAHDKAMKPIERVFFYLPLEHAENAEMQAHSVQAYTDLLDCLPEDTRPHYTGFLDYAIRHRDVIVRFGRFPDLNRILGRSSTTAELAFLEQPGSSFL